MKILIINEYYTPNIQGGAEISCQLLAESLVKMGHEVFVITTSDKNEFKIHNGVSVYYEKIKNLYWPHLNNPGNGRKTIWHLIDLYNIFVGARIAELLCKIKPDILHTNVISGFSCIVWKISKRYRIPVVHTLRDYYLLCYKATMFNHGKICMELCKLCKYTSYIKRMASLNVNAVVGISNFVLTKHLDYGFFKNVRFSKVIPNGVPHIQYSSKTRSKTIGFLGTISPSKGIERLIRDFELSNNGEYLLEIAGTPNNDYIEFLRKKYSLTHVRFIGRVNAGDFLQRISLLVAPSLWEEPFGRICIEAIANHCPIFVSNRGGMPEIIDDSVGRVFSLDKHDSLQILLKKFFNGELKFNFERFDLSKYDNENIALQYLKIYSSLAYDK